MSHRHRAGHEPRTARRAGRALLPRAAARAAGAREPTARRRWPRGRRRAVLRARASARPRLRLRRRQCLDAVAEICRRVDGLPLAIELAAARCGLLSPAEIATRLQGALDGLGAGPRDAPARQQTLRATIDWSHSLLSDDEKACFARFAVFAGGATVQAAETITGAGIDTLDRLVAKSLLVRRHEAHGPTRLGMLETVRAYAAERFAAAADEKRCESATTATSLRSPTATEPIRRSSARTATSTSRRSTAKSKTSTLPSNGRSSRTAPIQPSRCARRLAITGCGETDTRTRSTGSSRRSEQARRRSGGARAHTVHAGWALWPVGREAEQGRRSFGG